MNELRFSVKLVIYKNGKFFGPGVEQLLRRVDEMHSLSKASQSMSLAYTKALKMIRNAEKNLGFKLIEPKIGGEGGGGSKLTSKAYEILNAFEKYQDSVRAAAEDGFAEYKSVIEKLR